MINKNKEEIEKIEKEINNLERMKDGDLQLEYGLPIDKKVANKLFRHSLAERNLWELKKQRQERIKTSIEWCEDEIEFLIGIEVYAGSIMDIKICNKISELQSHLKWLKEKRGQDD